MEGAIAVYLPLLEIEGLRTPINYAPFDGINFQINTQSLNLTLYVDRAIFSKQKSKYLHLRKSSLNFTSKALCLSSKFFLKKINYPRPICEK